jgi:hypothetical protein
VPGVQGLLADSYARNAVAITPIVGPTPAIAFVRYRNLSGTNQNIPSLRDRKITARQNE